MKLATLCAAPGCTRVILAASKTGVCRDHMHRSGACRCRQCADPVFAAKNAAAASKRMKALNDDPEFAAKHAARMKARNADPEFAAKNAARMKARHADPEFNPLAALTPEQRADYDTLRSKGGYTREQALAAVRHEKR